MSSRWCPSCGSEWWTDAVACRDCGAALVDERPPEPDEVAVEAERVHGLAELDLPDVDQAGRWRLTLVLETNGFAHQWRGSTLLLPAAAVEMVEAELAGVDQLAPRGDEDDDDGPTDHVLEPLHDPGAPTGPPRLARVGGFVLDYIGYGLLYTVMTVIWGTDRVERWDDDVVRWHGMPTPLLWVYAAIVLAIPTIAVARWGRTSGMRIAGIEVTDGLGARLGGARSFVRTVLAFGWFVVNPILPLDVMSWEARGAMRTALVLWPLIVLGPALGRAGLGLHDRAVGSLVRRKERQRPA